jgi:hypothetical protein
MTEKAKKVLSESSRKPRDWYHPVHGKILQKPISELVRMFPDQKLCSKSLSRVAVKKIRKSKGWCLLKDKGVKYRSKRSIPRDWYHPEHGEVLQRSSTELIKDFPEDNLIQSCINRVGSGDIFHHREWRLLKNKDVKHKYRSNVVRDWHHPEYGKILQKTASELIKMFIDCQAILGDCNDALSFLCCSSLINFITLLLHYICFEIKHKMAKTQRHFYMTVGQHSPTR